MVSMAKCYIHSKKASTRNCSECSKAICHECTFQEVISSRVTRHSSYDRVVELDYNFYCPNCFITYSEFTGYDKGSRGVFFRFKNSPSLIGLIILWTFFIGGLVINIFFPIGYILWVGTIIAMIALKVTANRNYNKYLRAIRLSGKLVDVVPVAAAKTKRKDKNLCPNCGVNNPYGSKYCNECGSIL